MAAPPSRPAAVPGIGGQCDAVGEEAGGDLGLEVRLRHPAQAVDALPVSGRYGGLVHPGQKDLDPAGAQASVGLHVPQVLQVVGIYPGAQLLLQLPGGGLGGGVPLGKAPGELAAALRAGGVAEDGQQAEAVPPGGG